jgi:hypothetical protein
MPVPSISGGITVLTTCDTGSNGIAPGTVLASSTPISATSRFAGFATGINLTGSGAYDPSGTPASAALMGGIFAITATDFTVANRLAFFHYYNTNRVSAITVNTGLMFYCNSSSLGTEEAAYAVNGGNNPISAYDCAVVNLNRSTGSHLYSGTFDPSDVTHVGSAANFDLGFSTVQLDTFGYIDPFVVLDGTSGDNGDFTDITANINTNNAIINDSPTENIHLCFFAWGVGNGSTLTHFSDTLKVWEFTKQTDFTTDYGRAHINDNDIGFEVNASASDVIAFELCSWITESPIYWRSIGSTSATVSYVSCVTKNTGGTTVIVDGHTYNGHLFDACGSIQANSPTLANCTIKNATAHAIDLDSGGDANITNLLLDGNQTAVRVDVAGAAVLDVTQFTFETTNTYYIEYTGTGTLTVTSPVSIAAGKLNASGGGTITVVAPTTTFTINSSETGSFIQIFTTTTQTVLDSATSNTLAYDFSGTVVVDYVIQKAGFLPQRFVGVTLTDSSTSVAMVTSREYDSGHGLVYSTDASWASNQLTVPTFGVTGQGVFSLMLDSFIAQSALYNTAFNLEMDGTGSLYLTNGAEGNADSSIENLTNCGCAYLTSAQVTTALWAGVLSVGTATGFQGEYQQIDGTTTTDARATGIFNELIKAFGDASHGNFDYTGHLVLKYQPNTYRESRSNIIDSYSLTALTPTLYIVALEPVAIGISAGDPAISITIVDHTSSPLVVGGKSFDFEVQDNGTNDGNAILREINYNLSLDATYQGRDPFNWPELVLLSGTSYESIYGIVEGLSGLHGVYVSRSSADHPDFTRHQSNDGTYYVKPITANGTITSITAGSRLRIYNETTSTETVNAINATTGYSISYTEGTTYTSGDVISIYITYQSGVTAKLVFSTSVIAASTGWSAIAAQVDDDVYISNGIDGSLITKFTADYANDEIDVTTAANFTGPEVYAFYVSSITTAAGITNSFSGFTALDEGNYRNNVATVSMNMDNTTTTEVFQTDTSRIFRSDGARPVRNPTSGGGGIDVNWQNVVYVVTAGSILSAPQQAELTAAAQASTVNTKIGTPVADVSADIAAVKAVADAIPTTAMRGTDSANTVAPDNASITAIKAKTDSLTFTKANEVDSNVRSANSSTMIGTGEATDLWRHE